MYREKCSVRAGVFLNQEAQELLDSIITRNWNTITVDQLTRVASQMRTDVPNRRIFLADVCDITYDNSLDYEFRTMEAVRDAFARKTSRTRQVTKSVISETTEAGSTFSKNAEI